MKPFDDRGRAGASCASRWRHTSSRWLELACLACWLASSSAQAALQFDVFLGYDGILPEASWFPVVCEVKNDGPSFNGTVELVAGGYNQGQTIRLGLELPTGTLKRFTLPVFSATRGYSTWDIRLLDERGKVRAEQQGLRARKQVARGTPLMGALARAAGGTPVIKPVLPAAAELQPSVARFLPSIFPDNPLVLEGLDCLYLSSERASDLNVGQVNAIFAWLKAGGHLIVAVEQPADISSSPWLKTLFPVEVRDLQPLASHPELQEWLRGETWSTNNSFANDPQHQYGQRRATPLPMAGINNPFSDLPSDMGFETAELQVAVGKLREGKVELASGNKPLIVSAPRGRGRVTALLFSPEREPMRSWKNLPVFWAKLAEVPGAWYASKDFNVPGGWSSDGIFGAMIDTRQVHKLPVGWLLLLLLVYLVVIGPLDQYWLKRIGKPMLTWITFPCYVVLFSLVIYFIGYKLRAGESEWNELHVVDVLGSGEKADLRGRSYCSVYSPANQKYDLESQQKFATLRGEFAGLWGGGQATEKASILQRGDGFKAEIFVPVWTSELYAQDWWQPTAAPLQVSVRAQGQGWQVRVQNHTDHKLTGLQLALQDRIVPLGDVAANESRTVVVGPEMGMPLRTFVSNHGLGFREVIGYRQRALGATERGQISDLPNACMAISFLSQLAYQQGDYNFLAPPGLDLSPVVAQGGAVVLAWASDYAPVKPVYRFTPKRSQKNTLWRVPVLIESATTAETSGSG
jgi:hypothetical protein